jgi:hypothetical protein
MPRNVRTTEGRLIGGETPKWISAAVFARVLAVDLGAYSAAACKRKLLSESKGIPQESGRVERAARVQ